MIFGSSILLIWQIQQGLEVSFEVRDRDLFGSLRISVRLSITAHRYLNAGHHHNLVSSRKRSRIAYPYYILKERQKTYLFGINYTFHPFRAIDTKERRDDYAKTRHKNEFLERSCLRLVSKSHGSAIKT